MVLSSSSTPSSAFSFPYSLLQPPTTPHIPLPPSPLAPLALAAPATTAAAVPKAVDAAGSLASLKTAQIIPDVVSDFVPTATLTVDYGKMTPIKMGEQLLPSEAAMAPKVTFTGTDPKKVRGGREGRVGGWVESEGRECVDGLYGLNP